MSFAQELRNEARKIASAGLVGPAEEQALQKRLTDALAGELSFADATLMAYVAAAAAGGSGDGVGSMYGAWYSGIAAKFYDRATDARGAARRQCPD
ncbi:hypothetical protein [Bradyrhizobium retamae]|uniref:Uncharacterized protein n=1 Tax=Bradyrhizobium retamae TaxID=1300035 RepID=A0A0R3N626_9BRAD|nr:hypothetical protein [Bradyrhizobium retamae]KRR27498.1 hypothetical protein CQ13_03610 [Bradyrhizobium retamae]